MRVIAGTLVYPNGSTISGGILTFVADITSNQVLEGTYSTTAISVVGVYSITLVDGSYQVYLDRSGYPRILLGKITVTTGDTVTLDSLLYGSNPFIDSGTSAYVDSQLAAQLALLNNTLNNYLPIDYDADNTPTTPTNLVLSVLKQNPSNIPIFNIKAVWDPSTNDSNQFIGYYISYFDTATPSDVAGFVINEPLAYIPVTLGHEYTVTVTAQCLVGGNAVSAGSASGTLTVTDVGITALNIGLVVGTPGLGYIVLNWVKPTEVPNCNILVFVGTEDGFTPSIDNLIYSGKAPSHIYSVPDDAEQIDTPYFFKFVVQDITGELSSISGPAGPFSALALGDTAMGRLIRDSAFTAQHLANGAIVSDKIAAHAVVAGKFAVLDLTNLVTNQDFSIFDSTTDTWNGWDYGAGSPANIDTAPEGFIVLNANEIVDNDYHFTCSVGNKFYGAVRVKWTGDSGIGAKGFQIVFADVDGNELNSGYTGSTTSTTLPVEVDADGYYLIEGFETAPAGTSYGFIRIMVGAVTALITFSDIVCRKGSAVLIEDGEITAEKINVLDLFAQTVVVAGQLKINENVNGGSGDESGLIFGANGLQVYNSVGDVVIDFSNTGTGYFSGTLEANTIIGTNVLTGNINVGVQGKLYSGTKTSADSTVAGFFLGYDATAAKYKLSVGTGTAYLKWDGSVLSIKGNIVSSDISGSTITGGTVTGAQIIINDTAGSSVHSLNKDSYGDTTPGFWLGRDTDSVYKLKIGSSSKYLAWDGTDLIVAGLLKGSGIATVSSLLVRQYYLSGWQIEYSSPTIWINTGYSTSLLDYQSLVAYANVIAVSVTSSGSLPGAAESLGDIRCETHVIPYNPVYTSTTYTLNENQTIWIKVIVDITSFNGSWETSDYYWVYVNKVMWSIRELL